MHRELNFEHSIEQSLLLHGGYIKGDPLAYDKKLAIFPDEVVAFVQDTQPEFWERFSTLNNGNAKAVLIESLVRELRTKGMLSILRSGFKCFGKTVRMAFFAPNTGMDPVTQERFNKNRLTVIRQLETESGAIPDMVLAVNGLPVVSMELKNHLTGQNVLHAKQQYCDRDPNDLLFAFKQRCLVHFAVDTEEVYMITKLERGSSYFLPFNRGYNHGKGNPPVEGELRTSYLWEKVLVKESLMDILGRFLHLQVEEKTVPTGKGLKKLQSESMIFPRYHQLDVVRKLAEHARQHNSGHNYLIQHSTGSGKSNSIAWLAHRLSTLHDAGNEKIFHSVVVITDRVVLDQQLQDTIFQFEHKQGVVQKIDENTQQLAKALADGVPIIISTIQKFPFITQALATLEKKGQGIDISTTGRRFAVIVDEAHSSQSGETAMELKKILNREGIESAIAEQILDMNDEPISDEAKRSMLLEQIKRTKQPNLSFFAFTATPKFKTLAVFDEPGENGTSPFHLYCMRQAIEEGFILDVLKGYTCYKRYYQLVRTAEDDPELPRRKAARALARYVDLHDYNITQKVEIIVEHFRTHSRHKISGQAKAMVVTGSREHAVRYKLAFDNYLKAKKYHDIKTLVAFSGELSLNDHPGIRFTETQMNHGIRERELPERFASDEYQVLLVAEKYQTGFDQPLLHTMYVDKRLSGIQAVQTLSRLNRTCPGKESTFVLDFVNDPEEIYLSFKPYYETTGQGEETDPHQLNELAHKLDQWKVYDQSEVNAWCEIWFSNRMHPTGTEHKKLNSILDVVVERVIRLEEEEIELFKSQFTSFRNLYGFLSQVIPYQDSGLEKLYTFGRYLLSKLPRGTGKNVRIDDEVQLKYYRLEKYSEGSISLREGDAPPLAGPKEVGTGSADEEVPLSTLVEQLNERFGTDFTPADQLFFDQVQAAATENEKIRQAAEANTLSNFEPVFNQHLETLLLDRMNGNEAIFNRIMNDEAFKTFIAQKLMHNVFDKITRQAG
ncbi:MAG: type I restriction endonuclease subunit R [Chlorobiaceae bacterium]|nr:type I restriction endonuclease subunit R [Chlorobiaceae bacterium]